MSDSEWERRKRQMSSSGGRETHSRQSRGQAEARSKSDGIRTCRQCKGTGIKNDKPCKACKGVGGIDLKNV